MNYLLTFALRRMTGVVLVPISAAVQMRPTFGEAQSFADLGIVERGRG